MKNVHTVYLRSDLILSAAASSASHTCETSEVKSDQILCLVTKIFYRLLLTRELLTYFFVTDFLNT